jgi:hypothetical protein
MNAFINARAGLETSGEPVPPYIHELNQRRGGEDAGTRRLRMISAPSSPLEEEDGTRQGVNFSSPLEQPGPREAEDDALTAAPTSESLQSPKKKKRSIFKRLFKRKKLIHVAHPELEASQET